MLLLLPAPVTEDFVVRGKYWSKLKLICSQPHRRDKPFGVAMIRVLEELGSARSAVKVNLVSTKQWLLVIDHMIRHMTRHMMYHGCLCFEIRRRMNLRPICQR